VTRDLYSADFGTDTGQHSFYRYKKNGSLDGKRDFRAKREDNCFRKSLGNFNSDV